MNRKFFIAPLIGSILLIGSLPQAWAGIDHHAIWSGSTSISYGLDDLDDFSPAGYLYCKWGNLLDQNTLPPVDLHFNALTSRPFDTVTQNQDAPTADVFLSWRGGNNPRRRLFPPGTTWTTPSGTSAGSAVFWAGVLESSSVDLYRYFHFPNVLTNVLDNQLVDPSASKIVVLIHGWNPDSVANAYVGELGWLSAQLRTKLNRTDWKLVEYHWERDADTGPALLDSAYNGTEAAEIGHQHGWHLGELLSTQCPNLTKVHLVAHSAGSWVARAAARYLLSRNPTIRVEITLLDPFMPASLLGNDSSLGQSQMSDLDQRVLPAEFFLLENYYAKDPYVLGTQDTFYWRPTDINERLDDIEPFYDYHGGPIYWYADTVEAGTDTPSNPHLSGFDLWEGGWLRSLFCNEPVISVQPQDKTANIGDAVTFDVAARTRIGSYSHYHCGELTYQWRKDGNNLAGRTGPSLAIASVGATDAGAYSVIVSNSTGPVISQTARLSVNGGTLSPPDFSPASGSYQAPLDVALIGHPNDATIRYTLNGTTPDGSSPMYSGLPIRLTQTTTIKAKSQKSGYVDSPVRTSTYTLDTFGALPSVIAINGGNTVVGATTRQWFTIGGTGFAAGFSATFRDETHGTDWPTITDPARLLYDSAAQVRVFAGVGTEPTVWSVRITNPNGASSPKLNFNVLAPGSVPVVSTPLFSDVSGTFSAPIQLSMATGTPDAQIRYTTDSTDPTSSSQLYAGPIPISVTTTVKARAFKYGYTPSGVQTATFIISAPVTGSLRVSLGPSGAVQAGAQWQISGGTWHGNGETVSGLSVGNAVVVFNTPSGWVAPLAHWVTISAGQTTYDSATYTAQNAAPNTPANPNPANGAGNIGRANTVLSWTGGDPDGSVEYALKLGTDPNPGFYAGYGSIVGTSYTIPFTLTGGTVYYWGVRAKDNQGVTTDSPVWNFTTAYTYSDLVPVNLNVNGQVVPGSNVTLSVTVRNVGTFVGPFAYVRFYLSRSPGAKEIQLTPTVPDSRVYDIEPGQERTVTFEATLNDLQAGTSYIEAWVDSGEPGPYNENNFDNNLVSAQINYADACAPTVTWAQLGQGGYIRTAYTNRILYAATDDTGVRTIDFLYSTNGTATWNPIATNYVPPRNCTYGDWYDWFIPTSTPVTSNFYIKVIAKDSSGNSGERVAGPYLLRDGIAPFVQILSPNGGEVWDMGTTHDVTWTVSAPNGIARLGLYFYHDDTADYLADIRTNTSGRYVWTLRNNFSTMTGKLKIELMDSNANQATDWSDGCFIVRDTSAPPPTPWTTPEVLTTVPSNTATFRDDHSPTLAVDANGTVHMAYVYTEDTVWTNPRYVIQKILYKKRVGNSWTAPVQVGCVTQETDYVMHSSYTFTDLHIAVSPQGNPHLVWLNSYGMMSELNKNDVYVSSHNGTSWSSPVNLSDPIKGNYRVNGLIWTSKASLPLTIGRPHVVAFGGKIYCICGNQNYEYNPGTDVWTRKNDNQFGGVWDGGSVTIGSLIYSVSGYGGSIYIYNPATDSWSQGAAIPTARDYVNVVAAGGSVYAIGGGSTKNEMYNPSSGTWTTKADMPTSRSGEAAAAIGNKIYVVGGENSENYASVDVYDTLSDTWTNVAKPLAANWPSQAWGTPVVVSNRVVLIGGRDTKAVNEYDPSSNSWVPMAPLQVRRSTAGSAVVASNIYVVGGYDGVDYLASMESAKVSNGQIGAYSRSPSIAVDSSNTVHVAWQDGAGYRPDPGSMLGFSFYGTNNVFYASKKAQQQWTAAVQVTTNGAAGAQILVDGQQNLHLGYSYWVGTTNYIAHRIGTGTGWTVSPDSVQTMMNGNTLQMAADPQGRIHVIWPWYDQVNSTQGVFYSRFDGTTWSAPQNMYSPSVYSIAISADSFSQPHVILNDHNNTRSILYTMRNGTNWASPTTLNMSSQMPVDDGLGTALFAASNELHVTWDAQINGHDEIFYNHAIVGATNDTYPPSVSVSAPESGACLSISAPSVIRWIAIDGTSVTSCDLAYSTNSGVSWIQIASNVVNSGTCTWIVPNIGSSTGQVRVIARDPASNAGSGYSAFFTVSDLTPPTIALLAPTSGVVLIGASAVNIQWLATDNVAVTEIALEYSLDGAGSWFEIAHGLSNTNSVRWTVPNTSATGLMFRASARDDAGFSASATSQGALGIVRANAPPLQPNSPFPLASGANVTFVAPYLHWSSGDADGDPITYRVYFGTNASPALLLTGPADSFVPGFLRPQTVYYWQIIASDGKTNSLGPIWSFTTEPGETPCPLLGGFDRLTLDQFSLSIGGILGENYRIEYSTNLLSSSWDPITNATINMGPILIPIRIPTNHRAGFYRAVAP